MKPDDYISANLESDFGSFIPLLSLFVVSIKIHDPKTIKGVLQLFCILLSKSVGDSEKMKTEATEVKIS